MARPEFAPGRPVQRTRVSVPLAWGGFRRWGRSGFAPDRPCEDAWRACCLLIGGRRWPALAGSRGFFPAGGGGAWAQNCCPPGRRPRQAVVSRRHRYRRGARLFTLVATLVTPSYVITDAATAARSGYCGIFGRFPQIDNAYVATAFRSARVAAVGGQRTRRQANRDISLAVTSPSGTSLCRLVRAGEAVSL